jgi:hypothetical protein
MDEPRRRAGIGRYLAKPAEPDRLRAMLREAAARRPALA